MATQRTRRLPSPLKAPFYGPISKCVRRSPTISSLCAVSFILPQPSDTLKESPESPANCFRIRATCNLLPSSAGQGASPRRCNSRGPTGEGHRRNVRGRSSGGSGNSPSKRQYPQVIGRARVRSTRSRAVLGLRSRTARLFMRGKGRLLMHSLALDRALALNLRPAPNRSAGRPPQTKAAWVRRIMALTLTPSISVRLA